MEPNKINEILSQIENDRDNAREHILTLASALIEWMGLPFVENNKPRLLDFKTIKLKEALAPAPVTGQEQIYRLTAEKSDVKVRFAVLKKYDKKTVSYLVNDNVGIESFQTITGDQINNEEGTFYVSQQPYFIHFITTARYDKLWMVFNQNGQMRVLVFRDRLTHTQLYKILPLWQNIAARTKPAIAKAFWASLDIKEVNKEFYKKIKEQFDALVGIGKAQAKNEDENTIKQFAVRLIGRYIFCWFLKEKEIIPAELISSKTVDKYKKDFFQKYLYKLFFNTLNAEINDQLRNNLMTDLDELYKNIPYLNGGLFETHPEDFLFKKLDLNGWLYEFVKVLESFDFTVDESSSTYQQVSIDPEMLGRIFENLLASQNPDTEKMANQRKAFGAFYTPREIVDYMVNESLKAYLETQLLPELPENNNLAGEPQVAYKATLFQDLEPKQIIMSLDKSQLADIENRRNKLKEKIEKLFAPNCSENPFDKDDTAKARKALAEITVLDPACGSGAFPMGVMLRLMELRQIIGHGHRNNYDLKEEILSKNIFGVDIMPMAVEIARLRAWLSLALESDYKPNDRKNNFGIAALPNLDFKFVCANSLIDSGYDKFLTIFNKTKKEGKANLLNLGIQKLEKLRNEYFDPKGDKNKKEEIKKEFHKIQQNIKTEFVSFKKTWNLADFLSKVDDWKPFDNSKSSSFFSPSWMFGVDNGFNVVIGNPPYVQMQKDSGKLAELLKGMNYSTFERTGDVYAIFYELGFRVLKNGGIHTFITSSQWMKANYGKSLRKLFLSKNPLKIIALGPCVFESAVVDTNIIIVRNENNKRELKGALVEKPEQLEHINFLVLQPMSYVTVENWAIQDFRKQSINSKIKIKGKLLKDWDVKINFGIKTGFNEAFIIDESKKDELIKADKKSGEIIKPILRGREIEKYYTEWDGGYIINTHNGIKPKKINRINVDKYKIIKNHLNKYINKLIERADQGETPYNLRNCAYLEEFQKEKLVWKRIGSILRFSYFGYEIYSLDSTCIATGEKIKYLTGLLNSKLCHYQLFENAPRTGMGDLIISVQALEPLLVYYPDEQEQLKIEVLVDQILSEKKSNPRADTASLEREIDLIVYKLYGLTHEEVKVVDPGFEMSEGEYEGWKVL